MQFLHLMRQFPFVRIIIPFIAGIIAGFKIQPRTELLFSILVMLLFTIYIIHKLFISFKTRWVLGTGINLLLFILGIYFINFHNNQIEKNNQFNNRYLNYRAIVIKDPAEKENSIGTILRVQILSDSSNTKNSFRVIAYFQKESRAKDLNVGDIMIVRSRFKEIEEPKNPYEFNYKNRMHLKGIDLTTYISSISWKKTGTKNNITSFAAGIRGKILEIYDKCGIESDELGVLSALTLGYRDYLSDEVTQFYAASGAMHILAVSGLHVGIIFLMMNYLLFFLKRKPFGKILRLILIILTLWLFAAVAGFSPSVMRAAFMFSVIQIGYTLRKPPEIYNNIAFSAFVLLLINPFQIADVGFQLSYLAVTGIVFFQPKFYNLLYIKNKLFDKIWQLITVSIAAQLATAPVTIFYFHYFPAYFWLTNIFVIPIVGLIIYMAVFLILTYFLNLPYIFIGKILFYILKFQNFLIFKVQGLPNAMIENLDISPVQIVLYFILLTSLTVFLIRKKHLFLHLSFITFIALLMSHTLTIVKHENQKKVVVFNIRNKTVVTIVRGRTAIFFSDYDDSAIMTDIFQVKNFLVKCGIKKVNNYSINNSEIPFTDKFISFKKAGENIFFGLENFKGIILVNPEICNTKYLHKMNIDCIVLADNAKVNLKNLSECFSFRYLILAASNSYQYRAGWLKTRNSSKLHIHSVTDNNAFVMGIN